MGERISNYSRDSVSRSSVMAYSLGEFINPVKAIIFRIKRICNGEISCENDPHSLFNTDFSEEQIVLDRKALRVRRVYLVSFVQYQVSWVVDCDVSKCMACLATFNWRRFRHHCRFLFVLEEWIFVFKIKSEKNRSLILSFSHSLFLSFMPTRACGSLVCSSCSPYKTPINFLNEEGGSRVCKNCFGIRKTEGFSLPEDNSNNNIYIGGIAGAGRSNSDSSNTNGYNAAARQLERQSLFKGTAGIFSPNEHRSADSHWNPNATAAVATDQSRISFLNSLDSFELNQLRKYKEAYMLV